MDSEQADKSLRKPGEIYDERADNPKRPIFLNDKTRRVFLSLMLIATVTIHIVYKGAFAEEQSKGQFEISTGVEFGIGDQIPAHDLMMFPLDVGYILPHEYAPDHWYRGHLEGILELFTGYQYHPGTAIVDGGSLVIQYNLDIPQSKFVPFINFGAGMVLTNIGPPNLGGHTNFDLQAETGLH
jgi:hypothetical protein